jgi:hypothetical protein
MVFHIAQLCEERIVKIFLKNFDWEGRGGLEKSD